MAVSRVAKEHTIRFYKEKWEEWSAQRIAKKRWLTETDRPTHPVSFKDLKQELRVLKKFIGREIPDQLLAEIEKRRLVNSDGRWNRARAELNGDTERIIGQQAAIIIARGGRPHPTYAMLAWDLFVEAQNFEAAKLQVQRAYERYGVQAEVISTNGTPPNVK